MTSPTSEPVSVLTFATEFPSIPVQRFAPYPCRQDFGGVVCQVRCGGQAKAGEAPAAQRALSVWQLWTVVVVCPAEPIQTASTASQS